MRGVPYREERKELRRLVKENKKKESYIFSQKEIEIPQHIAIIMDGNGRWAQKRGLPRTMGHRAGVEALREVIKTCDEIGVQYLTLYAFSTENWKRPKEEVNVLMALLQEYLKREIDELHEKNVRIKFLGRLKELPTGAQNQIRIALEKTMNNTGLQVNIALNYGGRAEIIDAVKAIAQEVQKGSLEPSDINEKVFSSFLYEPETPDPELLIRPSGELRISNFLLWQIAYTELWITDVLWPDFRKEHLFQAIYDYNHRHRRFGGI